MHKPESVMEHEDDGDTIYNLHTWNGSQELLLGEWKSWKLEYEPTPPKLQHY